MGYSSAREIRAYISEDQALAWHLQHNHYPPIPLIFLPVVQRALRYARAGEWQRRLTLPTGKVVSVENVVQGVHLEAFLDGEVDTI